MPKVNCCCLYCKNELYRKPSILKRKSNVFCNGSHQLKWEYENGLRNGITITKKAHEVIKTKGHYKRNNSYLSNRF